MHCTYFLPHFLPHPARIEAGRSELNIEKAWELNLKLRRLFKTSEIHYIVASITNMGKF